MDQATSNLRALAIVQAQMSRGLDKPSDYLLPLVSASVYKRKGAPFLVEEIVESVKTDFFIDIPVYLLESLIPTLVKQSVIERSEVIDGYVCCGIESDDFVDQLSSEEISDLEISLERFARENGLDKPLSSENWQKALIAFFADLDPEKSVSMLNGKIINNSKSVDDRILSKFLTYLRYSNSPLFEVAKKIYVAFSIADTVAMINNTGHFENWDGLVIFYDTTVLMRLLGTSGEFLFNATLQMHSLLRDIGCSVFYFGHNLSEVFQNLEAIKQKQISGGRIHKETASALSQGEISSANINMLIGNADKKLGEYGITQFKMPPRLSSVEGQINPKDLEDYLTDNINYKNNGDAARVDADSVEGILFLRKGNKDIDLPKSRFVFVTHNTKYSKVTRDYCIERCGYNQSDSPPVVTLNTLTRLSWLASENQDNKIDISEQLMINCFQASLPDARWLDEFWKTISSVKPELLEEDTQDAMYLLDVRNLAEDETLGSYALIPRLDVNELMNKARKIHEEKTEVHKGQLEALEREKELLLQIHKENISSLEEEKDKEIIGAVERERRVLENKKKQEVIEENIRVNQEIKERVKKKADRHASLITNVLSVVVASILLWICFVVEFNDFPDFIAEDDEFLLRVIVALLAFIQVLGMFVDKLSFISLKPYLKVFLSSVLFKIYRTD